MGKGFFQIQIAYRQMFIFIFISGFDFFFASVVCQRIQDISFGFVVLLFWHEYFGLGYRRDLLFFYFFFFVIFPYYLVNLILLEGLRSAVLKHGLGRLKGGMRLFPVKSEKPLFIKIFKHVPDLYSSISICRIKSKNILNKVYFKNEIKMIIITCFCGAGWKRCCTIFTIG